MRPEGAPPAWYPKGLYIGIVNQAVAANGHPTVDIPELGGADVPSHAELIDFDPATGGASAGTAHTHGLTGPTFHHGDRVLVAFLGGSQDRPVILGRCT